MIPGAHEIPLVDVPAGVIVDLSVIPDLVNHGLPVLLLYDQIREVSHQIAELLVAEPGQFGVLIHHKEPLKAPLHLRFKLVSEMFDRLIGKPPQRKIAGVVEPIAGNVTIGAVLERNLEELPDGPGVAIPDQLQKTVRPDHLTGFLRVQQLTDVPWQRQKFRAFLHQFSGQRIK